MRSLQNWPKSLVMVVLIALSGMGSGAAAAGSLAYRSLTTGDADQSSEDGTEVPSPGLGGEADEEGASEDETPAAREPEPSAPGGCMFDGKKPLQLMV